MDPDGQYIFESGKRILLASALKDNYGSILNYLWWLCSDADLAGDLTQDVMVKAMLKYRQFKGKSSFKTWLIRIAANRFRDFCKKKKPGNWSDPDMLPDSHTPENEAITREKTNAVRRALAGLPLKYREVLTLKYFRQFSYEEIAEALAIPAGTVRSRIHNGTAMLKKPLEDFYG